MLCNESLICHCDLVSNLVGTLEASAFEDLYLEFNIDGHIKDFTLESFSLPGKSKEVSKLETLYTTQQISIHSFLAEHILPTCSNFYLINLDFRPTLLRPSPHKSQERISTAKESSQPPTDPSPFPPFPADNPPHHFHCTPTPSPSATANQAMSSARR